MVVGNTCASLELQSGHPFVNPTAFTATSASYTLNDDELAGGLFATLILPFAVSTLPNSSTAYTLDQDIDLIDGNVRGTAVTSFAANTPVLVTAAGSYTGSNVEVPAVAQGATFTSGELVGTYTAQQAPVGSYVLQNHTSGEGVAFYLVGTTQPTVNPFRAYIKAQASNVKALRVDFDADGLENIATDANEQRNSTVFDLTGRRIQQPTRKGIYVIDGKKVIVK